MPRAQQRLEAMDRGLIPRELVRNVFRYLDLAALRAMACSSMSLRSVVLDDSLLYLKLARRKMEALETVLPSAVQLMIPGVMSEALRCWRSAIMLEACRNKILRVLLHPLHSANGGKVLVSQYLRILDIIVSVRAEDVIHQILLPAAQGQRNSPFSGQPSTTFEILFALHALHRLMTEHHYVLGPWVRGSLHRLFRGPPMGQVCVAWWVMGSLSVYGGFRTRDVLRSVRADLRSLARLVLGLPLAEVHAEGEAEGLFSTLGGLRETWAPLDPAAITVEAR